MTPTQAPAQTACSTRAPVHPRSPASPPSPASSCSPLAAAQRPLRSVMRPRLRRAGRSLIRWVGKVGGLEDRCRFQRTLRARPQLRSEGNFDWLTSRGNSDRRGGGGRKREADFGGRCPARRSHSSHGSGGWCADDARGSMGCGSRDSVSQTRRGSRVKGKQNDTCGTWRYGVLN
jgi:hypothetical protein